MNLLILPKYGRKAASYRYRFEQFLPVLAANGIHCTVAPLFSDAFVAARMRDGSRLPLAATAGALFGRIKASLDAGKFDAVLLHCEALPFAPGLIEASFRLRSIPYVYDFDDAIFHQYDAHASPAIRFFFSEKIARVIRGAAGVFAGSEYLASYASRLNPSVTLVPTSVDLARYSQKIFTATPRGFVIGWIGSPSTSRYLRRVERPLRRFLDARADARFVAVGSGPLTLDLPRTEVREWNEAREIEDLHEFDAGVMPLDDDVWSRGKCGFKLIQCMACGVPVVASPVGENARIVGDAGFLARDDDEWFAAFEALYRDRAALAAMGARGRDIVNKNYSIEAQVPRIVAGLKSAVGSSHRLRASAHQ